MKSVKSPQTSPSSIVIEEARLEDAQVLRRIQLETWYATYPNDAAGITLEGLKQRQEGENGEKNEQRISFWRKQIETAGSTHAVFMARISGRTVGYVAPAFMEGQWRIGALYVLPQSQSGGVGSKLLQKALGWHGEDRDVYLHVASYNEKAIIFYQRFGFELTGKQFEDDAPANANIPELEMLRRASS